MRARARVRDERTPNLVALALSVIEHRVSRSLRARARRSRSSTLVCALSALCSLLGKELTHVSKIERTLGGPELGTPEAQSHVSSFDDEFPPITPRMGTCTSLALSQGPRSISKRKFEVSTCSALRGGEA
ncbi:hypothetical protein HGRIS_011403 [Hohenbuehelia grisea]|uniref:Uncharacterized protein n=1 Tax=Hohenbuehelia grisea TaxID=104357 RepID=A0ABR3JWZ6_9AGAR